MSPPKCAIDRDILNVETLPEMKDIALSFFAAACGKNRGAFVTDPSDGNTYGCLNFPQEIAALSGATDVGNVTIGNANAIKEQYVAKNITAPDTLSILDFLVQSVYHSSPGKDLDPYACEFNGLAKLDCEAGASDSPRSDGEPIRSVTLAGLFVPALWATGGKALTLKEASDWYTLKDLKEIKTLGLNTVQIEVPTAAFIPNDEYGVKVKPVLKKLLSDIETAGLEAILVVVSTGDEQDAVVAAAKFAAERPVVLALTLPSGMKLDTRTVISAVRAVTPTLPVLVSVHKEDIAQMSAGFGDHVYGALKLSNSATIADVASSTSTDDRSKLFYHEAITCMKRSPLEFSACFKQMPIFVSSGFDLSVDDCINQDITSDFNDYGQCDRFSETTDSGWWFRHRQSLAARQLFAFEQGLGWSFAAWKLYDTENAGVIDSPAKLLSLQDVAVAGLFPDLNALIPADSACLNPPENDFILGDDTLAPSMAPAPSCGQGWWNYTTSQCDYWIPPPDPTPSPTVACPVCESCNDPPSPVVQAGLAGALGGALIVAAIFKFCVKSKRSDYSAIPN